MIPDEVLNESVRYLQCEVGEWAETAFQRRPAKRLVWGIFKHMRREMEELEAEISYPLQESDNVSAVAEETADIAILLLELANCAGFDLCEAIKKKMAINRERRWVPDGDGSWRHVREGG